MTSVVIISLLSATDKVEERTVDSHDRNRITAMTSSTNPVAIDIAHPLDGIKENQLHS